MAEIPPSSIPADLPPTYEWRRHNGGVDLSPHLLRLRWRAWDPIESIRVLEDATDADSPQQSYGLATHPIAAEPLTLQPVSTMVVSISSQDMWEEAWLAEHGTHADLDDDEGLESFGARLAVPNPTDDEWWMVEDLAEEQGKDVDDDDFEMPACRRVYCGLDRPPADVPRATIHGTGDGGVLTIGDWIKGMHALIDRERENILACRGVMHGDCQSDVRPDEVLYVDPTVRFDGVDLVGDRDVILQSTSRPPTGWDDTFQRWAGQPAIRAAEAERKAREAAKIAAGVPPCLCWRSKEQPCPHATMAGAPCRPNPDTFPLHAPVGPPNNWWEVGWNGYTGAPPEGQ
ncbi:hypothetical protein CkaCkLH20_03496 [Colletotrichum karsti]|uniref:Uncharacterized protein n=1 Tax=Colletotrichum karsti TaxID=1095194 RepID=A0A9P6I8R1_9PEZI|nr:uncharacterized protein CkaCkLH20_03496 [Colletotrichum karsti]KAF9879263.1 hypothetical protein CkaCkLH20_03496 [Colletotrichum karsti]